MFLYTYLVKHMVTKKYGHIHINEIQKKGLSPLSGPF